MSTSFPVQVEDEVDYPTGDGTPLAETPLHRDNLLETVWMLQRWYEAAGRDDVYVSGNMFVYYAKGDRRRHLAPDVFVVHGVGNHYRDCYKTWEESKLSLDLAIEFTSRTTREEDLQDKFELYRDELGVREYLLFDPYAEYLDPPQQLFRLIDDEYEPVEPLDGRLPSDVLALHFERDDKRLRLWDPIEESWQLFPHEIADEYEAAQEEILHLRRSHQDLQRELNEVRTEDQQRDIEIDRLRSELASLKRRIAESDDNGGD